MIESVQQTNNFSTTAVKQSPAATPTVKGRGRPLLLFLGLITALAVGVLAGVFIERMFQNKKTAATNSGAQTGIVLDPTNILTSPIFTEWLGSVEGKLVAKDNESFTLEKDGSSLKIYIQQSLTAFLGEATASGMLPKIPLADIPVGTYLRGGVTISRGTLTNKAGQSIIGNGFTIVKDPNSEK